MNVHAPEVNTSQSRVQPKEGLVDTVLIRYDNSLKQALLATGEDIAAKPVRTSLFSNKAPEPPKEPKPDDIVRYLLQ
jgi:hypothetical protein